MVPAPVAIHLYICTVPLLVSVRLLPCFCLLTSQERRAVPLLDSVKSPSFSTRYAYAVPIDIFGSTVHPRYSEATTPSATTTVPCGAESIANMAPCCSSDYARYPRIHNLPCADHYTNSFRLSSVVYLVRSHNLPW